MDNQSQQTYGQQGLQGLQSLLALIPHLAQQAMAGGIPGSPAQAGMNMGMNIMQSPAGQPNASMMSPTAVKAAQKVLSERYTQHAQATPTDVLEHTVNQAQPQAGAGDGGSPQPQQPQGQEGSQQQQGGGFNPMQAIMSLLGGTQGGYNPQTGNQQVPGLLGGLITSTPQMLSAMNEVRAGNPGYIANKPMTPMETKTLQAGAYGATIGMYKDQLQEFDAQRKDIEDLMSKVGLEQRNPLSKFFGGSGSALSSLSKQRALLMQQSNQVRQQMGQLLNPNLPNAQASQGSPGNSFSREEIMAELAKRGEK